VTDSANLELVRSLFADWERGDYSSSAWADPEIEFVRADGPELGTWTGLDGLAQAVRHILSTWKDYRQEAEEYRELDSERILVLYRRRGRGKTSGVELGKIAERGASLFYVRGGKVTRLVGYFDRDRAFADLGLSSEADASGS
jgi:ketosteroid isomerase-like protein